MEIVLPSPTYAQLDLLPQDCSGCGCAVTPHNSVPVQGKSYCVSCTVAVVHRSIQTRWAKDAVTAKQQADAAHVRHQAKAIAQRERQQQYRQTNVARDAMKPKLTFACDGCGRPFELSPAQAQRRRANKYCTWECYCQTQARARTRARAQATPYLQKGHMP